jgi:hypothetical protein
MFGPEAIFFRNLLEIAPFDNVNDRMGSQIERIFKLNCEFISSFFCYIGITKITPINPRRQ